MKYHIGAIALLVIFCIGFLNAMAEIAVPSNSSEMCSSAETFLSRVGLGSWIDDGKSRGIQCFDVNEQGEIAIGFSGISSRKKYISIYDTEGNFLYGYSFQCSGSYLIEWDDKEQLAIYWLRSSVRATFDRNGKCIEYFPYTIDKVMNKKLNNLGGASRTIGDERFYIDKGDGFISQFALGYSRVIHVTSEGIENTVYSATTSSTLSGLFVILTICFIAFAVIYSYKKRSQILN